MIRREGARMLVSGPVTLANVAALLEDGVKYEQQVDVDGREIHGHDGIHHEL